MHKLMIALIVTLSFGTTSALAVSATKDNCLKTLKKAMASVKDKTDGVKKTEGLILVFCNQIGELQGKANLEKLFQGIVDSTNEALHLLVEKKGAQLDDSDYLK